MVEIPKGLRSYRALLTAFAVFYLVSLWFIAQQYHKPLLAKVRGGSKAVTATSGNPSDDVRNATLGFGKVFVINMKERTDKLDAVVMSASLTGFHVDAIEGVIGMEVSNRSLPIDGVPKKSEWIQKKMNNIIGCWRSHLNFAHRIVSENLLSGLVMEDDADWSVYLKDQLVHVAEGSRYISDPSRKTTEFQSPYGDDWDMLWLGHCGSKFRDQSPHYLIENDPTVPPPEQRTQDHAPDFDSAGYDNTTRVVYRTGDGLCTQAYALSLRGARKLLLHYTRPIHFAPIDIGLRELCHDQILGFKCIAAFPTLWGSHRPAGPKNRDSDIQRWNPDAKVEMREKGLTWNIVHSMRLNAENILVGGLDAVTTQWPVPQLTGEILTRYV
ncbi:hypothetical protein MMC22_006552 [Lobaria immixta]|nr:hypothetical protein [Lobaria immixta]